MRILKLSTRAFRNIDIPVFQPTDGINLILGDNAQGKTSLLEAVHFCAYMKSFRTSRTKDMIRDGENSASVTSLFDDKGMESLLQVTIREGARSVTIDGQRGGSLKDVVGRLKVVTMTPEQVDLFDGPPGLRRSFVDSTIVMMQPDYANVLIEYQRAIKNRNILLKEGGDDAVFDAIEQAICRLAVSIADRRSWAAGILTEAMQTTSSMVLGGDEAAKITYLPSGPREISEQAYRDMFARNRERDSIVGYSTKGPHADDFRIELHGKPARARASRGQRKALLVAVKLGQARSIAKFTKTEPVLLFDDLFGDLDNNMQARIWDVLTQWPGQSVITSVKSPLKTKGCNTIIMKDGKIRG